MRKSISFKLADYEPMINGYYWQAENPKASVLLFHGMAEYILRYDAFAESLNKAGFDVYGFDYCGHGTSKLPDQLVGVIPDKDLVLEVLRCMKAEFDFIQEEAPAKEFYLFAHSMGSMIAQRYIELYPNDFKKVILSGTDIGSIKYKAAKMIVGGRVKKHGYYSYSDFVDSLSIDAFDKKFKKEGKSAWLSVNKENVEKYKADPLCGERYPIGYYYSLATLLIEAAKDENLKQIAAKEILLISGENDPVTNFGKSPVSLAKKYQKLGINAEVKIYKGLRHETLNEEKSESDKVIADIVSFYNR